MSITLRWRLLDSGTGATLTDCADVDGLFSDDVHPPEPHRERYTLTSCAPDGPLRAAVDGTGPDRLGNLLVEGAHLPDRPVGERCDPDCRFCYEHIEELLDVRVVGWRASADGLFDIDVEGHRRDESNNHRGTVAPIAFGNRLFVWPSATGADEEQPVGVCGEVAGLFCERPDPWPPGPPLTLLGCDATLSGSVAAELAQNSVGGTAHKLGWEHRVVGRVVGTRPSTLGDGLVDVSLDARIPEPLSADDRPFWDLWHEGGPVEPNRWAPLGPDDRYRWLVAATLNARTGPRPAVGHLDGRHVTDLPGFFCALGEAVNGPGGAFAISLFWLHQNADPGLRLVWHDADVARAHLVPGYDRQLWTPAVTFDDLVRRLTEDFGGLELR